MPKPEGQTLPARSHPTAPCVPLTQRCLRSQPAVPLPPEELFSGSWIPPLSTAACTRELKNWFWYDCAQTLVKATVLKGNTQRIGNLSCTCYLAAWSSAARPAIHFKKHRMLRQGLGFRESQDHQYPEARATAKAQWANTVGGTTRGKTDQSAHPNSCNCGLWNKKILIY